MPTIPGAQTREPRATSNATSNSSAILTVPHQPPETPVTEQLPATLPPALAAKLNAHTPADTSPPCHRCNSSATTSWQRAATDTEREGYWDAIEQNIRAQPNLFDASNAEYTADRSAPVTKAVFGCDKHDLSPAPADAGKKAAATARQAGADLRTLTHAADCGGHGECQCGGAK